MNRKRKKIYWVDLLNMIEGSFLISFGFTLPQFFSKENIFRRSTFEYSWPSTFVQKIRKLEHKGAKKKM